MNGFNGQRDQLNTIKMRRLIKNNVLPGTFISITILWLATYDVDVNSISGLWHTDYWLLYTAVLGLNGILFMIGDNQIINKIAGLLLIGVLLFPIQAHGFRVEDSLHYILAVAFFIVKSLNHRKYDFILIIAIGTTLFSLGYSMYQIEIVELYALLYTGYLKKKNYFRKYRIYVKSKQNKNG